VSIFYPVQLEIHASRTAQFVRWFGGRQKPGGGKEGVLQGGLPDELAGLQGRWAKGMPPLVSSSKNISCGAPTTTKGPINVTLSPLTTMQTASRPSRHCRLQRRQRCHVACNRPRLFVPRPAQIIVRLQARPQFRAGAKEPRQPQGGVRRDAALGQNNLVDPKTGPRRNRSVEYDTPNDTYARFLLEEILPAVGKTYNLTDLAIGPSPIRRWPPR